jgi:hypothetical protein
MKVTQIITHSKFTGNIVIEFSGSHESIQSTKARLKLEIDKFFDDISKERLMMQINNEYSIIRGLHINP